MKLFLYTDGGSRGNPGPAAAGIYLVDDQDLQVSAKSKYLGEATNNQAEYQALVLGLKEATSQMGDSSEITLQVFMDSELIIRQMNGEYRVKEAGLKPLHEKASNLAEGFGQISFTHIRREKNAIADALVNAELDRQS